MKKVLSIVALGLFMMSMAISCKKEEPKSSTKVEEPQKRDWLDGKTFEYIEDADLPADQRQANDFTFVFEDGKLKFMHISQDGREADGEYVHIVIEGNADYTYEKPNIVLTNIKMMSTESTYKNGVKESKTEEVEPNDLFTKLKVDEEENGILVPIDPEKDEYSIVPLKK